ncbi:GGDEF domain-containing protein [Alteromonadaceae bacterium M269]|nr:GGDEF domain-containing protein [Alteromonadaceae bacterium M269]
MEQLNPIYDSTANDGFFDFSRQDNGLTDAALNSVILELVKSIDIKHLLSVYFKQLQRFTSIKGICLQFDDERLSRGDTTPAMQSHKLDYRIEHRVYASVTYYDAKLVDVRDWRYLHSLHKCFTNPLKNALEHLMIKRLATKDHLTSLGNRVCYEETLNKLISQAYRKGDSFSLLALDLNKFKAVNDTYGHQTGDKVLTVFSQVLQHCLRDIDHAFRLGGDEFCCLLVDIDQEESQLVMQRIHKMVAENKLLKKYNVSCSIGAAIFDKLDTSDSLFARADEELYSQKKA